MARKVIADALGATIFAHRSARCWSVSDLAKKADISKSYLSKLENGHQDPTVRVVCRIAKALGMKPSELFSVLDKGVNLG